MTIENANQLIEDNQIAFLRADIRLESPDELMGHNQASGNLEYCGSSLLGFTTGRSAVTLVTMHSETVTEPPRTLRLGCVDSPRRVRAIDGVG